MTAVSCNTSSPAQRWAITSATEALVAGGAGAAGVVTIQSADKKLCLGFDSNTSAYGGQGNSVVARPCSGNTHVTRGTGDVNVRTQHTPLWRWTETAGGSFLQTWEPHNTCSGFPGQKRPCECAHLVACAACHGTDIYLPPASVELWECAAGPAMDWSALQVQDGGQAKGALLMTAGLCLQAATAQSSAVTIDAKAAATPPGSQGQRRRQRVQLKTAQDLVAEAAPAPVVTKVRVTVTATNGVPDAHINEIRLYETHGVASFPQKEQH